MEMEEKNLNQLTNNVPNLTTKKRNKIINLTTDEQIERDSRLWKFLVHKTKPLDDNRLTARKIFDHIIKNYA
jgi:hypothetical protein